MTSNWCFNADEVPDLVVGDAAGPAAPSPRMEHLARSPRPGPATVEDRSLPSRDPHRASPSYPYSAPIAPAGWRASTMRRTGGLRTRCGPRHPPFCVPRAADSAQWRKGPRAAPPSPLVAGPPTTARPRPSPRSPPRAADPRAGDGQRHMGAVEAWRAVAQYWFSRRRPARPSAPGGWNEARTVAPADARHPSTSVSDSANPPRADRDQAPTVTGPSSTAHTADTPPAKWPARTDLQSRGSFASSGVPDQGGADSARSRPPRMPTAPRRRHPRGMGFGTVVGSVSRSDRRPHPRSPPPASRSVTNRRSLEAAGPSPRTPSLEFASPRAEDRCGSSRRPGVCSVLVHDKSAGRSPSSLPRPSARINV